MKNTATNNLGYTGIVTISRYIGKNKIKIAQVKNTGGQSLFDFFSDCLVGDYQSAEIHRPVKIMLLKYTEKLVGGVLKLEVEKASDRFLYPTTKPEKIYKASASTVRYSFIISGDQLQNTDFNGIGLYTDEVTRDDDCNKYAAFCKVDNLDDMVITPSALLAVDWELNILNKAN